MRSRSLLSRSPAFMSLWAGQTASQFGFQVATIATSTIAITLLHASNHDLGVLGALQTAAFLLIGLPAGAWVDGWRKRPTMIVADLVRVAVLATVPLAQAFGSLTLTHLMVVAAILGIATVFFDVAYQSYVPALVGPGLVADANGRLEASFQVARVGGPGLGGWLLGVIAAPFVYLFTAATYLFSALAILSIHETESRPLREDEAGLWRRISEGIDYVRSEPLLGPLFACIAGSAFFSQGQVVLLPVLILRELGMSATTLGVLLSLGATGGIVGAIARPWITRRLGEGRSIVVCAVAGVLVCFGLPASAGLGQWAAPVIVGVSVVSSFFLTIYNVTQMSLRQRICPPQLLGRLNATFRFAVWGMMPLGSLACGALAEVLGTTSALVVFIAGNLLTAALIAVTPAGRLDTRRDPRRIPSQ